MCIKNSNSPWYLWSFLISFFSYRHANQWICVIYKLICRKQRFSWVFVWNCVCELYCCRFLADIAFQPMMLVVCRNKLFVHGSVIKQSKPIASRLHSVRFCIFHWKGQEVLYGDLFLCLCKVGNETCNKIKKHPGFTAPLLVPVVSAVDYPHSEVKLGTRTLESEVSAPAGLYSFQYVEGH